MEDGRHSQTFMQRTKGRIQHNSKYIQNNVSSCVLVSYTPCVFKHLLWKFNVFQDY